MLCVFQWNPSHLSSLHVYKPFFLSSCSNNSPTSRWEACQIQGNPFKKNLTSPFSFFRIHWLRSIAPQHKALGGLCRFSISRPDRAAQTIHSLSHCPPFPWFPVAFSILQGFFFLFLLTISCSLLRYILIWNYICGECGLGLRSSG